MFLNPIYAFVDLVRKNQKKNMVVCEIGTSDGSTTRAYIDIIKQNNGKLYAIDWFNGNIGAGGGPHVYNESNSENVYNHFRQNLSDYLDIIEIKRGKSHDMISLLPDNSIDICFIDAGHFYSDVYKDIELILPKMKKDGIISGHDCEDMSLANKLGKEWLEKDFVGVPSPDMPMDHPHYGLKWVHYGVIQAVFDHFGEDVLSVPDPDGQGVNIFVKYLENKL